MYYVDDVSTVSCRRLSTAFALLLFNGGRPLTAAFSGIRYTCLVFSVAKAGSVSGRVFSFLVLSAQKVVDCIPASRLFPCVFLGWVRLFVQMRTVAWSQGAVIRDGCVCDRVTFYLSGVICLPTCLCTRVSAVQTRILTPGSWPTAQTPTRVLHGIWKNNMLTESIYYYCYQAHQKSTAIHKFLIH